MDVNLNQNTGPGQLDNAEIGSPKVCPHCGHCPHCGSPKHPQYPQPWPKWPTPYVGDEVTPFWYSTCVPTYGGIGYSGA